MVEKISVPLLGEAKVQKNGQSLFIYLPIKKCEERSIQKGSRVQYNIVNTGLPPEPPTERAMAMLGKKDEKEEEGTPIEPIALD